MPNRRRETGTASLDPESGSVPVPIRVFRFTKEKLEALGPEEKRYDVWDTQVQAFGLRVGPSGIKTFFVRYRPGGRGTKHRRVTLGRFGGLTVDEARKSAKKLQGRVINHEDPIQEVEDRLKEAETRLREAEECEPVRKVKDLVDRFEEKHISTHLKPSTAKTYRLILKNNVLPVLGNLPVRDIEFENLDDLHKAMKHTPRHANQMLAVVSKMFTLAELWKFDRARNSNPCRGIERFKEERRERVPSSKEVRALGKAIEKFEREGRNPYALAAVKLLLFLGLRRSEVINLKWVGVDWRAKVLRTGSKTGDIVANLNTQAITVLKGLWKIRIAGNPYVLPGQRSGGKLGSLRDMWDDLRDEAKLEDLRMHDLRHHLGTEAAMLGMTEAMIGSLLHHQSPAMTRRYTNLNDLAKRDASNRVGAVIAEKLWGRVKHKKTKEQE